MVKMADMPENMHEWEVGVSLDQDDQTFRITRIRRVDGGKYLQFNGRYIIATAPDEIGAYAEVRRILTRLGFESGAR